MGSLYTLSCQDASGHGLSGAGTGAGVNADTSTDADTNANTDVKANARGAQPPTPLDDQSPKKFEQQPHIIFEHDHLAYSLVILKQSVNTSHKAEFVVTSYSPDVYENINFRVTDGFTQFYAEGLSWQVKSVIPPGKPAQPYGPMGPFAMAWPGWLWPSVVLLGVALLSTLFYFFYKRHRWRVLMNKIKLPPTHLSPSDQFYKELRQALSQYELASGTTLAPGKQPPANKRPSLGHQLSVSSGGVSSAGAPSFSQALEQVLRRYLVRRYHIPAVYQNRSQIIKSLKKRVPRDKRNLLQHILMQLQNARQPDPQSQQQLAKMLRQWVSETS